MDRAEHLQQPLPHEAHLLRLFERSAPLTIFDVGACEAEDSIRYSRLFPNSSVYSFEPLPENAALARASLEQHHADRVRLVEAALSDRSGELEFFVSGGAPEFASGSEDWSYGNKSSSLLPPKDLSETPWLTFERVVKVRAMRGHDFCTQEKISRIALLHLDVQGAELQCLRGFELNLLPIETIWMEVSVEEIYAGQPLLPEIKAFMRKNGYALALLRLGGKSGDALFVRRAYLARHVRAALGFATERLEQFAARVRRFLARRLRTIG